MFNLAQMLEYGDGVLQDKLTAFNWYQKVVKEGDPNLSKEAQKKCDKLQPLLNSGPQYQDANMSLGFQNLNFK